MSASLFPPDALTTLRAYRALAPWGLRDLTALAGAMLDASGVFPLSASARPRPTERTVRFYVTRGLVNPPEGRGTAAVYGYRHLLQVLAIKLRQMEGATLETIEQELTPLTGDLLERRVAQALGAALPMPDQLVLRADGRPLRGRAGRARQHWHAASAGRDIPSSLVRRIQVEPGVELLVDDQHLLLRQVDSVRLAALIREALGMANRAVEAGGPPAAGEDAPPASAPRPPGTAADVLALPH